MAKAYTPPVATVSDVSAEEAVPRKRQTSSPPPRPSIPATDILAGAGPSDAPPPAPSREDAARALIAGCEEELKRATDKMRLARLHYEIARQLEHPLGQLKEAVAHFQKAHDLNRDHLPTLRGLRRTLVATDALKPAAALLDAEARSCSDPVQKARLLLSKGRLLEDGLSQRTEAREAYRSAATLAASDPWVLKASSQSAALADDWAQLARTYERAANVHTDPRLRAALLVQRAQILETRLGQPDLAVEQYEAALEIDPSCMRSISALKRLYHARGRLRDRVRMLEIEAARTSDPNVQTASLYEAARLWSERLGNRKKAVEALEHALEVRPTDALLLEELARLREEEQDWAGLVEALSRRVESAGDEECVAWMHRLGQLCHDRLDDTQMAIGWFERALQVDPTYTPALQGLAPLYERGERHTDLVRMHLAEAAATGDSQRRAAAHARVARLFEEQLKDPTQAASHHERALAAVDLYPASFRALTRLYSSMKRWAELAELYERSVEGNRGAEAVSHLLRIGAIHEEHLDDPVQAVHAYRRALELAPDSLAAIQGLARVAEAAGRHADLVEALETEANLATDSVRKVALLHRAGEVLDEQLNDRERAVKALQLVLKVNPKHAPSLSALGRIYYRAGRWEDLLATYAAELGLSEPGEHAARLHLKMGELCERHLGRHEEATKHYRAAGELTPADATATEALGRKLHEQEAWPELLKLWERAAKHLKSEQDRARAHFRRGEVLEMHLARVDNAVEAFTEALKIAPDYRPALSALARLRFQRGEWQQLATQLEEDAERLQDPELQVNALARASSIYRDQIRDGAKAANGYLRVLEADPSHPEALNALEFLSRTQGDAETLRRVLTAQAQQFTDVQAQAVALHELARAQQVRDGGEEADAQLRDTLEALLERNPDDLQALESVEALALRTRDESLLRRADEAASTRGGSDLLAAAHQTRLAEGLEAEDGARALQLYRAALKGDPSNFAAVRGFSRLAQQTGSPDLLNEAASGEAEVLRDSGQAALLLVQAAATRLRQGSERERALGELERALELDPDCAAAAHHLRDALVEESEYGRLVQLLNRAAAASRTPVHASRLWRESARVAADHQEEVPAAISALRRALRQVPDDPASVALLANLLERDGQWNEAAEQLSHLIELREDPAVQVKARLRLAILADEHAHDDSTATRHLRAVLEHQPRNRDALRHLSEILSRKDAGSDEAAEVVTRLVETADTPQARIASLMQLARVETRRKNADRAALALIEAVAVEGPGRGAGAAFRDGIGSTTTWKQYSVALQRYVDSQTAFIGAPPAAYEELARVFAHELSDDERALKALQQGLAQHPSNLDLRAELAERLTATGAHHDAATALRSALAVDVERAQTWRDLVACFDALGRPNAAGLAREALLVLGAATKGERRADADRERTPATARQGSLTVEAAAELSEGLMPSGAAGELLSVLNEGVAKLYPADLQAYGVSTRQRLTAKSTHPIRQLAGRLASIVGAGEFDLYLHTQRNRGVGIELTQPPSLFVPAALAEQPTSTQVFTLSRLLALVAMGMQTLEKLGPREVEVLLASYARNVLPQFGAGLTSEDLLNDQAKRMHKALPRRQRKPAEDLARKYVDQEIAVFGRWVVARQRVATRIAAMLSDDLPAAAGVLGGPGRAAEGSTVADAEDDALTDLLRFWVAEPTLQLRKRAGMPRSDG